VAVDDVVRVVLSVQSLDESPRLGRGGRLFDHPACAGTQFDVHGTLRSFGWEAERYAEQEKLCGVQRADNDAALQRHHRRSTYQISPRSANDRQPLSATIM
jgi:hypothetical protein